MEFSITHSIVNKIQKHTHNNSGIQRIGHDEARILLEKSSQERRGELVRPSGTYELAKAKMDEAIRTNAEPSAKLIRMNTHLNRWEAYLGIGKVSSFPVVINAAINDVCNARCLFCPYDPEVATHGRIKLENLRNATWLKFVSRFRPNGALAEPLSHPEITEVMEVVRTNAPFIDLALTTNASLMTPRLADAIAGYVSTMRLSLNAARKDTYEYLMAPLKWEKTLDNLRRLQDAKERLNTSKPIITASYVLNKHNFDELPDLPSVIASVGITTAAVVEMYIPPSLNSRKVFTAQDTVQVSSEKIKSVYSDFYKECKIHNVNLISPLPYT